MISETLQRALLKAKRMPFINLLEGGRWKVGDITIHHPNPSLLLPSFRRSTPALSCLESVCAKRTALSVGGRIRVGRVV